MVAAHVIATYSGQSYTSFVEERIFAPLGMTSSTFSPTKAEASGNFTQGWTKEGRRVPECFTEDTAFAMAGPGGVISNAVDMVSAYFFQWIWTLRSSECVLQAKWISTWVGEGVHDNQTVISPAVYQNVSYSYSVSTDHPVDPEHSIVGYGMGWFRSSYRGHDVRVGYLGPSCPIANETSGRLSLRGSSWAFYARLLPTERRDRYNSVRKW